MRTPAIAQQLKGSSTNSAGKPILNGKRISVCQPENSAGIKGEGTGCTRVILRAHQMIFCLVAAGFSLRVK